MLTMFGGCAARPESWPPLNTKDLPTRSTHGGSSCVVTPPSSRSSSTCAGEAHGNAPCDAATLGANVHRSVEVQRLQLQSRDKQPLPTGVRERLTVASAWGILVGSGSSEFSSLHQILRHLPRVSPADSNKSQVFLWEEF